MTYIRLLWKLLRKGPKLLHEVADTLEALRALIVETRLDYLNGDLSQARLAERFAAVAQELADVITLVKELGFAPRSD